jgi:hypothetical protein
MVLGCENDPDFKDPDGTTTVEQNADEEEQVIKNIQNCNISKHSGRIYCD